MPFSCPPSRWSRRTRLVALRCGDQIFLFFEISGDQNWTTMQMQALMYCRHTAGGGVMRRRSNRPTQQKVRRFSKHPQAWCAASPSEERATAADASICVRAYRCSTNSRSLALWQPQGETFDSPMRPCLVSKFFPAVLVTSILRIYTCNIKCS